MLENARKIADGARLDTDVCIVGAGAAGITLALELAEKGKSVILLEAGGKNSSGPSIELYRGELLDTEHHLPLDGDRYRQLGGTTGLWGGRCIPYDEIDLEPRDYVPYSGWPFSWDTLVPYYRRAHTYCECGEFDYSARSSLADGHEQMIEGMVDGDISTDTLERWGPPTHFGKAYRKQLKAHDKVRVLLHAVCCRILASRGDDVFRISGVEVCTYAGTRFHVYAQQTVLAGGGLEVTRLLLAAEREYGSSFDNQSGWLGRGYMCHWSGVIAKVQFPAETHVLFGYEKDRQGVFCRRRFTVTPAAQRKHKLLNAYITLDRPLLGDAEHGSGLMSLAFLVKTFIGKPDSSTAVGNGKYGLYWRHLRNIVAGSPQIFMVLPRWSRNRFLQGRRIPSLLAPTANNVYYLYFHSEQVPDKDSRVSLSKEVDRFGVPRLKVDFRITEQDVDSVQRTHELLAQALREQGLGELSYLDEDVPASIRRQKATLGHHIGGTRMAPHPDDGVVDADCRVFGTENLFVAGPSVFPTSSQANPVLTIVAMAIRLADHLKSEPAGCGGRNAVP